MKSSLALCALAVSFAGSPCAAQSKSPPSLPAHSAPVAPFHYVVDPSLAKELRIYHESDDSSHTVALVKDDKGVTSEFVEDEVVVRNDPDEVKALVARYHARVVRQIIVNMFSAEGKPLPPARTTPQTVLQIDASSSPLHLEEEAPKIKASGTHAFSTAKSANLAAIVAHERAAGHAVLLNSLLHGLQFPTTSTEQPDLNGVSDAYSWPEFDHRAWQYVLDAGIQTHPLVAIIDSGFWLNSQGIPCGYSIDALCQTSPPAVGHSDLPLIIVQGNANGGTSLAGGPTAFSCSAGPCPWHGNKSASVALGAIDNHTGAAGMGGIVATPILINTTGSVSEVSGSIQAAVAYGASIISISMGGNCGFWCTFETLIDGLDAAASAYSQGSLVVAGAGNNAQDAWSNGFWPCISALCVGAMNSFPDGNNYFTQMNGIGAPFSNFGASVSIWAPTNIHAMPDGSSSGTLPAHTGTSASTPYVAGVAALMKAVNSSLTASQMRSILLSTGTNIVTSAPPDNQPQWGVLIAPFEAVVLANYGKDVKPSVVITAPQNGARISEPYQGVTFTASALDLLAGSPPASSAGNRWQTTYCDDENTCLPTPFSSAGFLNWPFPATALSLRLADTAMAANGLNWPVPNFTYTAGPIVWTSSVREDNPMIGVGYSASGGSSFVYVFSPTAPPGNRVITATFANAQGFSHSTKITVDYEPQLGGPTPVILYPPPGATFPAGTIPVRGYSLTGVNLGYLYCDRLEWQEGIAGTPIASTNYPPGTTVTGVCEAQVPFQAGTQTLKLTAKGPTGMVGSSEETLNITPLSQETTVSISDPTNNQQFVRYFGQDERIPLHAFVLNPPASGELTYTWSWYYSDTGTVHRTTIGAGQSQTWTTNSVCGLVTIEVVVTSRSLSSRPSAKTQIDVICSSNG